jgi:hypothetical protein
VAGAARRGVVDGHHYDVEMMSGDAVDPGDAVLQVSAGEERRPTSYIVDAVLRFLAASATGSDVVTCPALSLQGRTSSQLPPHRPPVHR